MTVADVMESTASGMVAVVCTISNRVAGEG
jgi:hypothetical protein